MTKNIPRSTGILPGEEDASSGWEIVLYLTSGLGLLLFAWLGSARFNVLIKSYSITSENPYNKIFWQIGGLFAFTSLHMILTMVWVSIFAFFLGKIAWSYRLGFLTSAFMAMMSWFPLMVNSPGSSGKYLLILGACFLGAFIGGLLVTIRETGLVENNFPPSEGLQLEMLEKHSRLADLMAPTPASKRIFDICLSVAGMIIFMPVWIFGAFLVWFENPGPLLFVKNSVGKGGINFHQFKFRTMIYGAEKISGPVLSSESDSRILVFGRFLRKTALDELPQLINILRGEMSFVGPRPQRTVLVNGYLDTMPEYAERHRVLPGLAGLAQVAGDYYLTPRQKLRFDRLYIQHARLGFDLNLLLLAISITFWFRWQSGWNGKLPRWMFRWDYRH
jgi:lipopolysaccharide/colanic/teichoic acid biosynthesis glycosyltransferase